MVRTTRSAPRPYRWWHAATLFLPWTLHAQPIVIPDEPTCASCRIALEPLQTLELRDGEDAFGNRFGHALRRRDGSFVAHDYASHRLLLFSPDGEFIRAVGVKGAGPGEIGEIRRIALLSADSLAVFDWANNRVLLFASDFTPVRSFRLPYIPDGASVVLALPSGSFVVNEDLRQRARIGLPLHVLSRDGTISRSYGAGRGAFRPGIPYLVSRSMALSDAGRVLAGWRTVYQLDEFVAETGRETRRFLRDARWFPPRLEPVRPGDERYGLIKKPEPFLGALQYDGPDRVWVVVSVADPQWKRGLESLANGKGQTIADPDRFYDSIVELIDLKAGQVIARQRFDLSPSWFADRRVLGNVTLDAEGYPFFRFFRLVVSTQ